MSQLLSALRAAELAHKARTGRFVTCPAEPSFIPKAPLPLSRQGCLARLVFSPGPVAWQLEAELQNGKLVVFARGHGEGGGALQVWYLEQDAAAARRVGAPHDDDDPDDDDEDDDASNPSRDNDE